MKKILMIGTGGTIASELTESGLTPGFSTEDLLRFVPTLKEMCEVDCLQVCSIDSTNMTPAHWLEIAACIREHYAAMTLCHHPRTDTMRIRRRPELSDPG